MTGVQTCALPICLDRNIMPDYFIGVSAGSANGSSFIAKQRGRNYRFYTEYAFRKEYMSMENMLKTGSYVNLDYIYGTLSNSDGEDPFDFEAFTKNPCDFEAVATNALTGEPYYFHKKYIKKDNYDFCKASSCVPRVNKPYVTNGIPMFDGGISDPIPYQKALDAGCDKLVIILTKPKYYFRTPAKDRIFSHRIPEEYKESRKCIINRSKIYNQELTDILELEETGKVLIIAPQNTENVATLTLDRDILNSLYRYGYRKGRLISRFINK